MNSQALTEVYSFERRSFLCVIRWIRLERETKASFCLSLIIFCALVPLALRGEDTFLRKMTPYS